MIRYTGTLEQIYELEGAILATDNFTCVKDKNRPDLKCQLKGDRSAYTAMYEVYLDMEAKQYTISVDQRFYLMGYPHAKITVAYFQRDGRAWADISNKKIAKLCSLYPDIANILGDLEVSTKQQHSIATNEA